MNKNLIACLGLLAALAPRPAACAEPNGAIEELQAFAETAGVTPKPAPTPASAPAPDPSGTEKATMTSTKLLARDAQDLEELYRRSEPGAIPSGSSQGTATIAPGTIVGAASKKLFSSLWYGKIFERVDDHSANLVNKTVLGHRFEAKVYIGKSLLDGKDAIIIDYAHTPFLPFRVIRDEIRQVGPGVYLGYAYLRGVDYAPILFALDFN